uniref:Uncharacterized protein n=1 Tax=Anguilla anguilla TaxID=7936 RepID=A0A0E9PMP0_ANGAN
MECNPAIRVDFYPFALATGCKAVSRWSGRRARQRWRVERRSRP